MSNPVLFAKKDHLGYITMNRPDSGNFIDLEMAQELIEICQQINQDEDIYAVLLSGSGNIFSGGGDERQGLFSTGIENLPAGQSAAEAVAGITRPTLAALNGDAMGQGLEVALACDLRIAAETARLGLPQIAEGFIPLDGGTQRLPRIVGKGKALEMVLTGKTIDAQEAWEIGLVNKVVPAPDLLPEAEALARTLAAKAPLALRYCKEAVNKGLDLTLEQGLRLEADLYFLLHTTADRTEGITSFLQKRPPQYRGQ